MKIIAVWAKMNLVYFRDQKNIAIFAHIFIGNNVDIALRRVYNVDTNKPKGGVDYGEKTKGEE